MANVGNNSAFEEDIAVEEGYNEDPEIQVDDVNPGNVLGHEFNGRVVQPPPPPPRVLQPVPRGYEAPAVIPRRGFGSPEFPAMRPFAHEDSTSLERLVEREYKFPLQPSTSRSWRRRTSSQSGRSESRARWVPYRVTVIR